MQNNELYNHISSFIVLGEKNERFINALSHEYGWSRYYAQKAYQEYLRFMYLLAIHDTPLAPSLQIERVWKFHLGYSDSYWHKLCEIIIKKPIHRNFSSTLNRGVEKDFFVDTHLLYREEFEQNPPIIVWGTPHNKYLNRFINNMLFLWSRRVCIVLTSLMVGAIFNYIKMG